MRADGLRGATRGKRFTTTRPDRAAARPPDLVHRDFTARAPNLLWLVDFTYVPTWSGTVFTAFVAAAFSRRIVGWRTASSMPTALPLDALEMAPGTRRAAKRRGGSTGPGSRPARTSPGWCTTPTPRASLGSRGRGNTCLYG